MEGILDGFLDGFDEGVNEGFVVEVVDGINDDIAVCIDDGRMVGSFDGKAEGSNDDP